MACDHGTQPIYVRPQRGAQVHGDVVEIVIVIRSGGSSAELSNFFVKVVAVEIVEHWA